MLTDRVFLAQGKNQIYGTQAQIVNGELVFDPIQDESDVNKLRQGMGLPPIELYRKEMEKMYGIKEHPEIEFN